MSQLKIKDLIMKNKELNIESTSFEICPKENCRSIRREIDELFYFTNSSQLFFSITWKLSSDESNNITKENASIFPPINLAKELIEEGDNVLLHISGGNMSKRILNIVLDECLKNSIKNILLVKGDDSTINRSEEHFNYVYQIIEYIREQYYDYFCIGVAGFPDIHPDCSETEVYFERLKQKIDAGADFIVTQYFFEPKKLYRSLKDAKNMR